MEPGIAQTITEFGAFGVLCVFAWVLLRAALKQSEKLGELLNNHLSKLLEHQTETNNVLKGLCEEQARQGEVLKEMCKELHEGRRENAKS